MTPQLPAAFLSVPLAHRALHDKKNGRPENSRSAVLAAIEHGYGIEIDLQLSSDGQAMVFHDYNLFRLTNARGKIRQRTAAEAATLTLKYGNGETIPTLPEILHLVQGRVPVLIEIKDQDGGMGPDVGPLERATAQALTGYDGPVAVMSFNPHSVMEMARLAPDVPRGLVTSAYVASDPNLSAATRERLRGIPDYDRSGSAFISHDCKDLSRPRVQQLRAQGIPVLCWTVRSEKDEAVARQLADNVTFEGYLARPVA